MKEADVLKNRTRHFALRVLRLYRSLPHTEEARIIGKLDARIVPAERLGTLIREANELISIVVASLRTAKDVTQTA